MSGGVCVGLTVNPGGDGFCSQGGRVSGWTTSVGGSVTGGVRPAVEEAAAGRDPRPAAAAVAR